ncbi:MULTISPECIES: sulfotransferase family 2 domain-containing protein [unclassified Marinobacter]|uniref:sulfotransferase family 2 domain-containing protein n=1 Tax=unclassified Marinobacter TaxID=83889 RepID=UPI0018F19585|nr:MULTISPECIES: sulfotransferase family 2 domain-containing protein [unclassified Marinobacter]
MIISDEYKFVFIHIPKCAGTSVRKPLEQFDSCQGSFTARVGSHPTFGRLDYVHIPLFILKDHFPNEFSAVKDYWAFAVVRDPFARFASSVSQRLKMYSDQPLQKRSEDEIRSFIDESIDYLLSQPRDKHLLPPEYIHFQKQVDYIELDGSRVIDKIYTVDEVDTLLADLGRRVSQDLQEGSSAYGGIQTNRSVVFRNDFLRRVIETGRPLTNIVSAVLPESAKQRIRKRVYVPRDQRMKDLFAADYVRAFINDYYADDIRLFQKVSQRDRSEAE